MVLMDRPVLTKAGVSKIAGVVTGVDAVFYVGEVVFALAQIPLRMLSLLA